VRPDHSSTAAAVKETVVAGTDKAALGVKAAAINLQEKKMSRIVRGVDSRGYQHVGPVVDTNSFDLGDVVATALTGGAWGAAKIASNISNGNSGEVTIRSNGETVRVTPIDRCNR